MVAAVLVFNLAPSGSADAQTTSPTAPPIAQSSDGVPFPIAISPKAEFDLPIIGRVLGSTPQAALRRHRVVHTSKSGKRIDKLRVEMWTDPRIYGIPQKKKTPWYCLRGFKNSRIAEIRLTDGRITKVTLHYRKMNNGHAARILRQLENGKTTYGDEESSLCEGYLERDGTPIRFKLMREATHSRRTLLWYPDRVTPDGVATLSFEISPVEWYLLNHDVMTSVRDAMRQGKPVLGMTEEEATVTLEETCRKKISRVTERSKIIEWSEPTDRGRGRHLKWSVKFEDGRVTGVISY